MGYYMFQNDCSFRIKKENLEPAFQAAKRMPRKHYSWINDINWCDHLSSLQEVLEEWRYEPETDPLTGDITHLDFNGEKIGDEDKLFQAIAPYVERDSYIEMQGEDGTRWRWVFDGQKCYKISPTISW